MSTRYFIIDSQPHNIVGIILKMWQELGIQTAGYITKNLGNTGVKIVENLANEGITNESEEDVWSGFLVGAAIGMIIGAIQTLRINGQLQKT